MHYTPIHEMTCFSSTFYPGESKNGSAFKSSQFGPQVCISPSRFGLGLGLGLGLAASNDTWFNNNNIYNVSQ